MSVNGGQKTNMKTLKAAQFLVIGPLILVMLFVINVMTSPGVWWVQWAALGIGIAWVANFLRVVRAAIVVGGLSALLAYFCNRKLRNDATNNQRSSFL